MTNTAATHTATRPSDNKTIEIHVKDGMAFAVTGDPSLAAVDTVPNRRPAFIAPVADMRAVGWKIRRVA